MQNTYYDRVRKDRVHKTLRLRELEKELERVIRLDKKKLDKRGLMLRKCHIDSIRDKIKAIRLQLYNI